MLYSVNEQRPRLKGLSRPHGIGSSHAPRAAAPVKGGGGLVRRDADERIQLHTVQYRTKLRQSARPGAIRWRAGRRGTSTPGTRSAAGMPDKGHWTETRDRVKCSPDTSRRGVVSRRNKESARWPKT